MDYFSYGLQIRSELPLPDLPTRPGESPDVTIRFGEVPPPPPGEHPSLPWRASPGQWFMALEGIARYRVSEGREVVIQPAEGSSEEDVRVFLLCSAWAALLHQRGVLPLHASSIQTDRGAVLFLGDSGAGKSTLLNVFLRRGHSMLADDISAVDVGRDGIPRVVPAFPATKLWADSLERLNLKDRPHRRVRPQIEKFMIPVEGFSDEPTPVHALYHLKVITSSNIEIRPLSGKTRFEALMQQIYRRRFSRPLQQSAIHFRKASIVAQCAQSFQADRPSHLYQPEELADRIEEVWG